MNFDIAIIGAGLAGLSAANAIMETGNSSFALIEGRDIGSNNPSPLTFPDILEEYNLSDCIKKKYTSFTFDNFKGSTVKYLFPNERLAVLNYKKACGKIFSKLDKAENRFQFINQYVTGVEKNSNNAFIQLENGQSISAKILIDASGRAQFAFNSESQRKTSYYSHVYGALFSNVQLPEDNMSAYLLPSQELGSGGGWFYSIGRKAASFGYAQITNTPKTNTKSLKAIFNAALEKFLPYCDYLHYAKIDHVETGVIPISYIDRFVYNNILIVGDAAGMATNWTCMGVEPALKYGALAGILSAESVAKNDTDILCSFQNQWEKENKDRFDLVAKQATTFWESDHYFWEWIIKNDLSHLSPEQLTDRLRNNGHLMKKYQIIARALKHKIKSMFNKSILNPQTFIIKDQPK